METTQTKLKRNCDEQAIGRKENIDFGFRISVRFEERNSQTEKS